MENVVEIETTEQGGNLLMYYYEFVLTIPLRGVSAILVFCLKIIATTPIQVKHIAHFTQ